MRYICLFILCLLTLPGFSQVKNDGFKEKLDSLYRHSVALMSVKQYKKLDKKTQLYILDTREEEEFEVSHLKHARHVGYYWFDMRKVYDIPRDATILVYCTIGTRGEKIGEKLERAGYKNVYNLYGGIIEWINTGNPVYKTNGVQTSEVHTYNEELAQWMERGAKVF